MPLGASLALASPACPICGSSEFVPGPKGRTAPNGKMPRCARCRSLERHRMFRLMFERLGTDAWKGRRAIQFSADPTLDPAWFGSFELSVFGGSESLDVQAIDRPSGAYDLVACSHVLEHVADDRAALHELMRIAAPSGLLWLVVPDPFREAETRDWGFPNREKHGHFRIYGADIAERFQRYMPEQRVHAYVGEDPVTGEWDGCFLLPKSPEWTRRIAARLGSDSWVFAGPGRDSKRKFLMSA